MFKKSKLMPIFIAVLILALMVPVVGCSSNEPASQSDEAASTSDEAAAPTFPEKPVKMIITHDPGSSIDIQARLIAPYIEKYLGQKLVLENMPGAGGRKARAFAFHAEPDGYTILATGFPSPAIGELMFQGDFKTMEFSFIGLFQGHDAQVVVVPKDSPYKTLKDLADASKEKPIVISTAGTGSTDHLAAVLLKESAGLNSTLVPFDSAGDQVMALLGGKVTVMIDNASNSGARPELRPLVVCADERNPMIPDVPTVAESGFPGVNISYCAGIVGPPNISEDVKQVLEDAVFKAASDPEYQEKLQAIKGIPQPLKGADMKALIQQMYDDTVKAVPAMEKDMQQ